MGPSPVAWEKRDCGVDQTDLNQLADAHVADHLVLVVIRQIEAVSLIKLILIVPWLNQEETAAAAAATSYYYYYYHDDDDMENFLQHCINRWMAAWLLTIATRSRHYWGEDIAHVSTFNQHIASRFVMQQPCMLK
jgi:hypothetical protein